MGPHKTEISKNIIICRFFSPATHSIELISKDVWKFKMLDMKKRNNFKGGTHINKTLTKKTQMAIKTLKHVQYT